MAPSKTSQLTEHALSAKLKRTLDKMPGVFAFKIHGGQYQRAGLPDWCVLFRGRIIRHVAGSTRYIAVSRTLFVELKSPKGRGKLTELQTATHKKIEGVGHDVIVVTSVDEVLAAMKERGYDSEL
jgi:hypothetical protein